MKIKTINRKRSRVGITFEKDNESYLVENVKLMLEVAKAKGWDLNNLHIRDTEQFINEVKNKYQLKMNP